MSSTHQISSGRQARAPALRLVVAQPALAKLSAPNLSRVAARARCFRILDRALAHPVVWISAPAGAGKTALVASYLETRRRANLWYRVDSTDNDAARFTYYLGLAANRIAPNKEPLPPLTAKSPSGLRDFGHDFFRELCFRLPGRVLVIDDLHEATGELPLHALLESGFWEIPNDVRLIVVSRTPPAPVYARLRASDRIALIDWEALRVTPAEANSVAVARLGRGAPPAEILRRLQEQTQGWMAGLVLALEGEGRKDLSAESPEQLRLLFDYFAHEVFARLEPAVRDFLRKVSLFTEMTAGMAAELSGEETAERILADLMQRQYFTSFTSKREGTYSFHPLFRKFLLQQAELRYSREELRALQSAAAELLVAHDRGEEAAMLLIQAGNAAGLGRLAVAKACGTLESGEYPALHQCLEGWPDEKRDDPWVSYWLGLCRLSSLPLEARRYFERAYHGFGQQGDVAGEYLSWAAIADSFTSVRDDFTPFVAWVKRLDDLLQRQPAFPSGEVEARVLVAALGALLHGYPQHPRLPSFAERIETMLRTIPDASLQARAAVSLSTYYLSTGDLHRFCSMERPLRVLMSTQGPVSLQLSAQIMVAQMQYFTGNITGFEKLVHQAYARASENAITCADYLVRTQLVYTLIASGKLDEAAQYADQLADISASRRLDWASYHHVSCWLAWWKGDGEKAYSHALGAEAVAQLHAPHAEAVHQITFALILYERGAHEEAHRRLARASDIAQSMDARLLTFECACTAAWFAQRENQGEKARILLADAFALGARENYLQHPRWRLEMMRTLCARAIECGIEPDYARRLIRHHRFLPDLAIVVDPEDWSWPVRIRTLGRLDIVIDGKSLQFSRKAQKKPLELLKALIAFSGRGAPEDRLAEELWPDAEADLATQSFATTLHRLRRLIGFETIERAEGRVRLDPSRCWIDASALERVYAEIEPACRADDHGRVAVLAQRILSLYQGHFLESEQDLPCVLNARERLRGRFLRHLEAAANCLARGGWHDEALSLCEKALEVDPLAESFYGGLIRSHLALNRPADALRAYERCSRTLVTHLGIAPSSETQRMMRGLPIEHIGQ